MPYSAISDAVLSGELVACQIQGPDISVPLMFAFPNHGVKTLTGKKLEELILQLSAEFIDNGRWQEKPGSGI